MAKPLFFFSLSLLSLLFLSLSSANLTTTTTTTTTVTAHTELNKYGFPIGLLPKSVTSYTVNHTSGDFSVDFGGACKITLPPDNYLATFSKKVTGKIVENRIAELHGISVRAFFQWWSITGIRSSGENLVFEVGMVSAKYPSKNFDESPECEGRRRSDS